LGGSVGSSIDISFLVEIACSAAAMGSKRVWWAGKLRMCAKEVKEGEKAKEKEERERLDSTGRSLYDFA
jgi:hypothetical protein